MNSNNAKQSTVGGVSRPNDPYKKGVSPATRVGGSTTGPGANKGPSGPGGFQPSVSGKSIGGSGSGYGGSFNNKF